MRLKMWAQRGRGKQLGLFRHGLCALVGCLILVPVAVVWDIIVPAASAGTVPEASSSTTLSVVALPDSTTPTLRAVVTGVSSSAGTPTGTVSFAIEGSDPIQCDDLTTNTVQMSGGVATCKVTSGLPASGSPETAQATFSGDGAITSSGGTFTSNDGTFTPSPPVVVTPPASIPDDCSSDAAPALVSWLSSLPQDSASRRIVVRFSAQACYVVNETLLLQGTTDLTINGNGATLRIPAWGADESSALALYGDTNLTIENLNIVGGYNGSNGGAGDENDYGVEFEGDNGITFTNDSLSNIQGDFLYFEPPYNLDNSNLNTGITIKDSTFTNAGYHGITDESSGCWTTAPCNGVTIENDSFDGMGTDAMDFEVDDYSTLFNPGSLVPQSFAQDYVTITDNTWSNWTADWFVSLQGQGPGVQQQHVTIACNILESSGPLFEIQGTNTAVGQYTNDWLSIYGNRFTAGNVAFPVRGGTSVPVFIYSVGHLVIENNDFPLATPGQYAMDLDDVIYGSITDNQFPDSQGGGGVPGVILPQPYDTYLYEVPVCGNTYTTPSGQSAIDATCS